MIRPRVFLSLGLATLSLAAVACTALLGDFEERSDVAFAGDALVDTVVDEATADAAGDADANAIVETPRFTCTAAPAESAGTIETNNGFGILRVHVVNSVSGAARIVTSQIVGELEVTRVTRFGEGPPAVNDLPGNLVAVERFPGGIAVVIQGRVPPGKDFLEDKNLLFLSKLYDTSGSWTTPIPVGELPPGEVPSVSFRVLDANQDKYLFAWSGFTCVDEAGVYPTCEGTSLLRAKRWTGDAGTEITLGAPTAGRSYLNSESIATFDGGVVILTTPANVQGGKFHITDSDLSTKSVAYAAGFLGTVLGISHDDVETDAIRLLAVGGGDGGITDPNCFTGRLAVSKLETINVVEDVRATKLASANDVAIAGVHWEDFVAGNDPHNAVVFGKSYADQSLLNFFWFDGTGNLRGRVNGIRRSDDAGAVNSDVAILTYSLSDRDGGSVSTNAHQFIGVYTIAGPLDGGIQQQTLWSQRINCVPDTSGAP